MKKENKNRMPEKYIEKWNDLFLDIAGWFIPYLMFVSVCVIAGILSKIL